MFNKYKKYNDTFKTDNEALILYIKEELKGNIPDYYRRTQGRIKINSKNDSEINNKTNDDNEDDDSIIIIIIIIFAIILLVIIIIIIFLRKKRKICLEQKSDLEMGIIKET